MEAEKTPSSGLSTRFEISPRFAIPCGLLVIALCSYPMLGLLGVVRGMNFNGPRWLLLPLSVCFPAVGAFLLFHGLAGLFDAASRLSRFFTWLGNFFITLLALCFFGGMAVFLTWQLFDPVPSATRIVVMGYPVTGRLAALLDKAVLGFVVLLFDLFVLVVLWHALKRVFSRGPAKRPDAAR